MSDSHPGNGKTISDCTQENGAGVICGLHDKQRGNMTIRPPNPPKKKVLVFACTFLVLKALNLFPTPF